MKYTPKQKQDYYYQQSKKGATYFDKKTGEVKLVSDFMRGVFLERGKTIYKMRVKVAKYYESKKKNKPKEKKIKTPPAWYLEQKNNSIPKQKEINVELVDLRDFFKSN